jgi:hypothetical protein
MRKNILCFAVASVALCTANSAHATLSEINNASGHVVYDDVSQKYWVWDLRAFSSQTNTEQLAKIATDYAGANYFGNSSWHLATFAETATLFSYAASDIEIFNSTYTAYHAEVTPNIPQVHWFGRSVGIGTSYGTWGVMDDAYFVSTGAWQSTPQYMGNTFIDPNGQFENIGAWVTTAVPEPASYAMLLTGLGLMAGVARRRLNDQSN